MGATYTRQSSFTDGDVITAAHSNDEFDQLLAAFQASSGHTHDGTANEGGPITKLLGTSLTIGDATSGTDITVTFDGETNDGVLTWMEDEDYFKFSDDVLINSTEKLYFYDEGGEYIYASANGQLDIVAGTEVQIATTTVDINAAVDISGATTFGGVLSLPDGSASAPSLTNTGDTNAGLYFSAADTLAFTAGGTAQITMADGVVAPVTDSDVDLGTSSLYFKNAYIDTVTTTGNVSIGGNLDVTGTFDLSDSNFTNAGDIQLDSITGDGDTNTSITFSGSDVITITTGGETQVTFNNGSILPTTDNDIDLGSGSYEFKDAYFDGTVTTDALVADTADINGGSVDGATLGTNSAITQAVIDNINIDGTTIGHTSDTDLLTLTSGVLTVAGEVDAASLDVSGDADIDGTTNLDAVDIDGAVQIDGATTFGVDDTGVDVKLFGATAGSYLLWDESADSLLLTDSTPIKIGDSQDFTLYHDGSNSYITNSTGALKIATETSGIAVTIGHTTSETTIADNLSVTGDIDVDGTANLDNTDIDGTLTVDGTAIDFNATSTLAIDNTNTSNGITIGTSTSGVPISIGHTTSETTVNDNLTVTGDLTVSGTTTTVNSTTVNLNDHNIILDSGNSTSAVINGAGITLEGGSGDDATFSYNTSGPKFELKLGSSYEDLKVAELIASSLDIDGVVNVGVDDTGYDVKFFGDTASRYWLWDTSADGVVQRGTLTVGVDDTGHDVKFFGATSGKYMEWDESADQLDVTGSFDVTGNSTMVGTLTVGVDDTGHDVKFFGATSGQYMLWDESADELVLAGDSKLSFHDAAGGENIIASSNGHLEINAGTTLDITAATTQVNAGTLFDVNGDADISGTLLVTGVATLTATPIANAGISVKNGATGAGYIDFYEDSDNGTNKVTLAGPASTADITLTLPTVAGTITTEAAALSEAVAMAIALG